MCSEQSCSNFMNMLRTLFVTMCVTFSFYLPQDVTTVMVLKFVKDMILWYIVIKNNLKTKLKKCVFSVCGFLFLWIQKTV